MLFNRFLYRATSYVICLTFVSTIQAQVFNEILLSQGDTVSTVSTDITGSGVSFYDFNQDGWDDLSFAIENDTQVIYQNNQGVLQPANFSIPNIGETKMLLWVDYDNDGDLDLFLTTKYGSPRLWKNNGAFSFTDETINAGISTMPAANFGASFGDYDRDGDLDLYLCRYPELGDSLNINDVNNLYQNNGDGTFSNVTWQAGVADGTNPSFLSVWYDYNLDGWQDLFVINDRNLFNSALYVNNQDGTFTDYASAAGIQMPNDNPMAGSFGDFDNDGDLDLFVGNTSTSHFLNDSPRFFVNQNDGTFIDLRSQYNLELSETTWGGLWIDYDNDLDQDLYVATDYLSNLPIYFRNYFLINEYPNPFVDDTSIINGSDVASSHAVARGDIDRNGFYDIAVHSDYPTLSSVWENTGNLNNYIRITLQGSISNSMAIGSWIKVFIDGNQYTQYTFCGENYLGQNSQHHIFGTGNATLVDSVQIEYLSGITDKYYNLNTNSDYLFTEGETIDTFSVSVIGANPMCSEDSVILSAPDYDHYLWNTGDTSQSIVVFEPGAYYVEVIDSFGFQNESFVVNIDTIETADILLDYVPISCNNATDGEIFLEVSNQGQEYTITWSNGQQGDTLSNLAAGLYTYVYEDEFSCKSEAQIFLEEPSPLNVQLSISPQTEDSWGSFQWLANGGIPPYTALFDGDTINSTEDSLEHGSYTFLLTDAYACSWQGNIDIPYEADSVISGLHGEIDLNNLQIYHHKSSNEIIIWTDASFPEELKLNLFNVLGKEIVLSKTIQENSGNKLVLISYKQPNYQGLFFLVVSIENQTKSFPLLFE